MAIREVHMSNKRYTEEFESELAQIRHELSFSSEAYSQHLKLVVDYHAQFWNHFQMCRRAALMPKVTNRQTKQEVDTRTEFTQRIESIVSDWQDYEGRMREILVICRSAQRAYAATRILNQNGYDARTLSGGTLARAMYSLGELIY